MKKNLVRIVALLLVAMLALTLIPMGALAATMDVESWIYGAEYPTYYEWGYATPYPSGTNSYVSGNTIKPSDFDKHIFTDGKYYDFVGFLQGGIFNSKVPSAPTTNDPAAWAQYDADMKKLGALPIFNGEIKIPDANSTAKEWAEWNKLYSYYIEAVYGTHQHKLSCWISDGTTHWRNCLVSEKQFLRQNWCQDGDEDGICNVCGGDVPYHDVTVIEDEGGKITVNKDLASHRTKITADVEVNEGYKLKKLHFTKIRDDGSRQEITRYKKNGQFWTRMPTYELEVSAEFVKK